MERGMQKARGIFTAALLLLFFLLTSVAGAEKGNVAIVVISLNDFHGAFTEDVKRPGLAKIAGYLADQRRVYPDAMVLLSAGDMLQGTLASNLTFGKPVIEAMNLLRFDAMALGNHEFDWGYAELKARASEANFPFLSANLADPRGILQGMVLPSFLVEKQGVKIGIIGLTTPETKEKVSYARIEPFAFTDPAESVIKQVAALRAKGAQIVIVDAHMGGYMRNGKPEGEIAALAKKIDGVDLIVSGHTHQRMQTVVNGIPILQAGYAGEALTKTVMLYSHDERKVLRVMPSVVALRGGALRPDAAMEAFVQKAERSVAFLQNQKIGTATAALPHDRYGDSAFGRYLTDLLREEVRTDIAFFNGGGIKAGLAEGVITAGDVYTALPFDNTLVTLEMTGAQITEALQVSLNRPDHARLQFSGLIVRARQGEEQVELLSVTLSDGTPLDQARVYRVATNDFIASGGGGLKILREIQQKDTGISVRDLVIARIKTVDVITPSLDERFQLEEAARPVEKSAA